MTDSHSIVLEHVHNNYVGPIRELAASYRGTIKRVPVRRDPSFCHISIRFEGASEIDAIRNARDFRQTWKKARGE